MIQQISWKVVTPVLFMMLAVTSVVYHYRSTSGYVVIKGKAEVSSVQPYLHSVPDGETDYEYDSIEQFWFTSTITPTQLTRDPYYNDWDMAQYLYSSTIDTPTQPKPDYTVKDVSPNLVLKRRPDPLQHVAFIKTHKCASSTVQNILMRYGLKNKLAFVLPKGRGNHIGWPNPFNPANQIRKMSKTSDIHCYHSVYSPKLVEFMPEDTFYLSAVRDPFTQVRSAYVYYNFHGCAKHTLSQVVDQVLSQPKCCGLQVLNAEIFDLGFPKNSMTDRDAIDKYINMLDKRFNLMMVVEYFDESLIILRDMLGWSNLDILSFAVNFRKDNSAANSKGHPGVDMEDNPANRQKVYSKFTADTQLYLHFKRKLLSIIEANKDYIEREKEKLRALRNEWMEFCVVKSVPSGQIPDARFRTYGNAAYGYILTKQGLLNQTCVDLAMAELPFVNRLDAYQPAAS